MALSRDLEMVDTWGCKKWEPLVELLRHSRERREPGMEQLVLQPCVGWGGGGSEHHRNILLGWKDPGTKSGEVQPSHYKG